MPRGDRKERIDCLLVERGFVESRSKAQALIMAGLVLVDERRVEKPSEVFQWDAKIRIKASLMKYVGRGGIKLEGALNAFSISPNGYVCLDVGASTGGFTDCLLQHGAKRVVALDVGQNQLAWKLRADQRVEVREKTNARYIKPEDFGEKFDLITVDVSFISVKKIIPALISLLKPNGRLLVLIKPQFEVGRNEVEKGGVIRDEKKHKRVIEEINEFALAKGLKVCGVVESPITGAEGNKEFFALYELLDFKAV
ncbi:MAG: TlyA family RNA methyltransferase [Pyrinomonadaceae bacterium]|nr:TlyA family RNA methyltransferase [Pyrinomonadaceae bacterium]MCX7640702.1 TlyA family RNA methyltransferase [Pyrinomonadaceae bacterium]MDW8305406.1 TlyA family RNA methyltransferase [Acidobacteriota bacterium]